MLSEQSIQRFGGRTIKIGDRVLARMVLKFEDPDGNELPSYVGECGAVCSRIDDDAPSFTAENPMENGVAIMIQQVRMPFVPTQDDLRLWSWTWPDAGSSQAA